MLTTGIAIHDREQVATALRLGANPNGKSLPLHKAVFCGFEDAVGLLIDAGANVNVSDDRKCTALHIAAQFHPKTCRATILKLIASGAKLDAKDDLGMTPLECAVEANNREAEATLRAIDHEGIKKIRSWARRAAAREKNRSPERKGK